jgi:hypothetical protein
MQHALGLVERRRFSSGAIMLTAERSTFFEARSEKDCDRRAAVLASRNPGAPMSRSTVKFPV